MLRSIPIRGFALALGLLLLWPTSVSAQERIIQYDVDVTVLTNGDIEIDETISVKA